MEQNRPTGPTGLPIRPQPHHPGRQPGPPRPPQQPTAAQRPTSAPQPQQAAPPPPPAPPRPPHKKAWPMITAVACLVIITIIVASLGASKLGGYFSAATAIKTSQYQAVFLTNNMVYFGKLSQIDSDYVKMTDIFYLQQTQAGQTQGQTQAQNTAESSQSKMSLAKLGSELHGPEDTMYINKKEIMFWENLKDDGKVAKAIRDYQSK